MMSFKGLRRPHVALLHIALVVIALGAVATWVFGEEGEIELGRPDPESTSILLRGDHRRMEPRPTSVGELISFEAPTYEGSEAARDYRAVVALGSDTVEIAVNHAAKVAGRVYTLHSYTPEAEIVTLKWRRDPIGEPLVLTGYVLALVALAWNLMKRSNRRMESGATPPRAIAEEGSRVSRGGVAPSSILLLAILLTPSSRGATFDNALRQLPVYWGDHVTTVDVMARDLKISESGKTLFNRLMYSSESLRIFPMDGRWYSPVSRELPFEMSSDEWLFVRKSLGLVNECLIRGDEARAAEILGKIEKYQRKSGVEMPSRARLDAERWYRRLAGNRWVAVGVIVLGLAGLLWNRRDKIATHSGPSPDGVEAGPGRGRPGFHPAEGVIFLLLIYVTGMLGMRWWLSGHVPMSNGFETMELAAWVALLIAVVARDGMMRAVGVLAAGLFMLVGSMSGASIAVGQLMPVLNSPWLSLHVSVIMISYTLFLVIGIMAAVNLLRGRGAHAPCLLLAAVSLLALGIVVGSVWASESWGRYWGWDPKETWALITLVIYCVPLHPSLVPALRRPRVYNIYMVGALLAVAVTYFGANYLLTGMHSYA